MFSNRPPAPGRYARSPFRLLAAAALAAGAAGFAPHGRTAEADPAAAAVADVALARAALSVLDADQYLRDYNLVVSVVDRVAVVGGPVASAELKARAEDLVRRVPGVRAVRNGCFVQAGDEPLLRAMAAASRPLPVLPPVVIPVRPTAASAAPSDELVAAAPRPEPAPATGERSVVTRRPVSPGENVLLPPVAARPAAFTQIVASYPAAPPAVLTGRPALADAVDAARRSEPRFAGLRTDLRDDGGVLISGTARHPSDAWDLAERVRAVPGVARVAVGPVGR
ncbi:MAG TPA: BON domain-containing protein [Urbifossiella sp.]|jgi:hypothetical protein|nr:BON domain-containing protein [Urbifossiella sp.]